MNNIMNNITVADALCYMYTSSTTKINGIRQKIADRLIRVELYCVYCCIFNLSLDVWLLVPGNPSIRLLLAIICSALGRFIVSFLLLKNSELLPQKVNSDYDDFNNPTMSLQSKMPKSTIMGAISYMYTFRFKTKENQRNTFNSAANCLFIVLYVGAYLLAILYSIIYEPSFTLFEQVLFCLPLGESCRLIVTIFIIAIAKIRINRL